MNTTTNGRLDFGLLISDLYGNHTMVKAIREIIAGQNNLLALNS